MPQSHFSSPVKVKYPIEHIVKESKSGETKENMMLHQSSYSNQPTRDTSRTKLKQTFQAGSIILLFCLGGISLPSYAMQPTSVAQAPPPSGTSTPASQTVVYVNPATGKDAPNAGLSQATPYRTITYALQQAKPGNKIQLAPGKYTAESGEKFPLLLKSDVTLQGDESNNGQAVVISGGGPYTSSTFGNQEITILAANTATLSGVTVTNPNKRGTGVWIETTSPVIRKSTFTNNKREGIFVTGKKTVFNPNVAEPRIEDNTFINNSASGISVHKESQGDIRSNVFRKTGFGLSIGGTSTPLVANNLIVDNQSGVVVGDSARPTLRNNQFENNVENGVVISGFSQAQPDLGTVASPGGNIFSGSGRYDINNPVKGDPISAIGNQLNSKLVVGQVNLKDPGSFPDVQNYWAQTYIGALARRNIISGFPDGTFRPDDPVTRAQFASIVTKAFPPGTQTQAAAIAFQDVPSNFWAYQPIQTAAQTGFLAGYPDGTFQPSQQIPRVQVLVSLVSGLNLGTGNPSLLSLYQDAAQIPAYATAKVAAATQRQIVVNYPTVNLLNPNRDATRAEVAAFVYQALVNAGKAEPIPSAYVVVPGP